MANKKHGYRILENCSPLLSCLLLSFLIWDLLCSLRQILCRARRKGDWCKAQPLNNFEKTRQSLCIKLFFFKKKPQFVSRDTSRTTVLGSVA
ncbi:hypothetical protein EI94DRAFT_1727122 [Lactarius quietus]|nr:hypothetical protein EI94DRAFT_1727122 [Lactarius quietus]